MSTLQFTVPYPPSVNTYWRHIVMGGKPRTITSKKGREYRTEVTCLLANMRQEPIAQPMIVRCLVFMPDRRRRDIDNILKSLLDSMQHAGIYEDDSLIKELNVRNCGVLKPGNVEIQIQWPWYVAFRHFAESKMGGEEDAEVSSRHESQDTA